jgi:hypothetical protein
MVDATRLDQHNLRLNPTEVQRVAALAERWGVDRSSAFRGAILIAERTEATLSPADRLAVTAGRRRGPVKPRPSGA